MASFQAHIKQAKKNLKILSETSQKINDCWDWQVTISYYVAVHLMNARLADKLNLHYKTHKDVKIALYNEYFACKIPDEIYTAYVSLENLSRRARYLCHEDSEIPNETEYHTYDRHLKKALSKLDIILNYFCIEHGLTFEKCAIDCLDIKSQILSNFYYKQDLKVG
ncbi:hypothetical protein [Mucilaginibacter sp.]|uniref:hypothetical protein n=1 Tax=Mucilaginibacter sp. TaxID=1882438 RepID=UPI00283D0E38|nr:hypothetical protein [Mucilaginibacter sp.]MDR3695655.1 hypothetical protein [Mucilaginibacter sp.]